MRRDLSLCLRTKLPVWDQVWILPRCATLYCLLNQLGRYFGLMPYVLLSYLGNHGSLYTNTTVLYVKHSGRIMIDWRWFLQICKPRRDTGIKNHILHLTSIVNKLYYTYNMKSKVHLGGWYINLIYSMRYHISLLLIGLISWLCF